MKRNKQVIKNGNVLIQFKKLIGYEKKQIGY